MVSWAPRANDVRQTAHAKSVTKPGTEKTNTIGTLVTKAFTMKMVCGMIIPRGDASEMTTQDIFGCMAVCLCSSAPVRFYGPESLEYLSNGHMGDFERILNPICPVHADSKGEPL